MLSRFITILRSASASLSTTGTSGSTRFASAMPCLRASDSTAFTVELTTSAGSTSACTVSNRPASRRATSMVLFTMSSSDLLFCLISVTRRCCLGSWSRVVFSQKSAAAMMDDRGVRSSWLMMVRKFDFCSFSLCSCSFARASGSMTHRCSANRMMSTMHSAMPTKKKMERARLLTDSCSYTPSGMMMLTAPATSPNSMPSFSNPAGSNSPAGSPWQSRQFCSTGSDDR